MLVFITAPSPLSNSFLLINKFSACFARRKNLLGYAPSQSRTGNKAISHVSPECFRRKVCVSL